MVVSKIWVTKTIPSGCPQEENFEIVEEYLPECRKGDIILEAEYVSVDPYIRYRIRMSKENSIVAGSQISKVIESKNCNFPIGSYVVIYSGWRTHSYVTQDELEDKNFKCMKLPDLGSYSRSTALGVLGMPGNTAYFGFLELCQPKHGDVVVVNAAAGAVGSTVCQIAKIKGCKVIAFAGSEVKVKWLKEIGVDFAFNYKSVNIAEVIKTAAPKGVNCYFDNVGGEFSAQVIPLMADFGRVSICGCISIYNAEDPTKISSPYGEATMLFKQLRVEGFLVSRWDVEHHLEGINQLKTWLDEGKLKYRETITDGFENVPKTFIGLFKGENIGKAVVKI